MVKEIKVEVKAVSRHKLMVGEETTIIIIERTPERRKKFLINALTNIAKTLKDKKTSFRGSVYKYEDKILMCNFQGCMEYNLDDYYEE